LITKKFKRQELVLILSHYGNQNQITGKSEHKIKRDQQN